jgi:hypothetical protein
MVAKTLATKKWTGGRKILSLDNLSDLVKTMVVIASLHTSTRLCNQRERKIL